MLLAEDLTYWDGDGKEIPIANPSDPAEEGIWIM